MLERIKNLIELSRFSPERVDGEVKLEEGVHKKPKKKLAKIIEMDEPIDQFPNEKEI